MHQRLLAALFFSMLSTFLIAMESVDLDPIELGEEGLTIEQAIGLLEKAKDQPFTFKGSALKTTGIMCAGIVMDILGGVGVGYTCPDANFFDGAIVVCGLSGTCLTLGGICTLLGIGMPLGFYCYNTHIVEPKNQKKTELCCHLSSLGPNTQLKGSELIQFLALIEGKKAIYEEVSRLCNGEQLQEMKPTLEIRAGEK